MVRTRGEGISRCGAPLARRSCKAEFTPQVRALKLNKLSKGWLITAWRVALAGLRSQDSDKRGPLTAERNLEQAGTTGHVTMPSL
jgi:hypothetical protein